MGVIRSLLVQDRLPHRNLSRGRPRKRRMKTITDRIAAFARADNFLSNMPPEITFNGFQAEGYILDPGSEAEAVLARAHKDATGKPLETFMTAAYLDARVYALYDKIPTLCYGGLGENIHGFDERASLASTKRITKAIALFIAEWCGTEAIQA